MEGSKNICVDYNRVLRSANTLNTIYTNLNSSMMNNVTDTLNDLYSKHNIGQVDIEIDKSNINKIQESIANLWEYMAGAVSCFTSTEIQIINDIKGPHAILGQPLASLTFNQERFKELIQNSDLYTAEEKAAILAGTMNVATTSEEFKEGLSDEDREKIKKYQMETNSVIAGYVNSALGIDPSIALMSGAGVFGYIESDLISDLRYFTAKEYLDKQTFPAILSEKGYKEELMNTLKEKYPGLSNEECESIVDRYIEEKNTSSEVDGDSDGDPDGDSDGDPDGDSDGDSDGNPGDGDDPDGDTGGAGGDNGGDYPKDNDGSSSTQARVETPSPNPSPSDTPNKVEKPTTDPTPEETPSDNTDTPSDNTGDNSNTGTDPETPSTGDDNNNTNTGNDSNNTKPDGGNNSNNNTGGNTNTGSGSNTNHGNTSRPSGNTGNNSGYYVPGNNNGGGTSSTPPTTPSAGENGNAATTTPSAPDSDAGIIDNSGEELDVISIDKGSSAKPSTSSNDGGSVIPAILGVGVAGAAGVAGVKYIKNKKEKDNEYEDDSINEDENSFSYIGDYQENADASNDNYNAISTGGKYKAGNVNKLVLDDAPENIKIEESMNDTTNQKEELE